jgi:hypothetical protein
MGQESGISLKHSISGLLVSYARRMIDNDDVSLLSTAPTAIYNLGATGMLLGTRDDNAVGLWRLSCYH